MQLKRVKTLYRRTRTYGADLPLMADRLQTLDHLAELFLGKDTLLLESLCIGNRAADVRAPHALVVAQRLVVCVHPAHQVQRRVPKRARVRTGGPSCQ